jgi:hypothetical protein
MSEHSICKRPDLLGRRSGLMHIDPSKEEERIIGTLVTRVALARSLLPDFGASANMQICTALDSISVAAASVVPRT